MHASAWLKIAATISRHKSLSLPRRKPQKMVVIGFLIARAVGRDWEIENILVAKGHQRQGIGGKLLGRFVERARAESAEKIFLEVRESNRAAIALYATTGFEEHGRRKCYYSSPEEDALLLRLTI